MSSRADYFIDYSQKFYRRSNRISSKWNSKNKKNNNSDDDGDDDDDDDNDNIKMFQGRFSDRWGLIRSFFLSSCSLGISPLLKIVFRVIFSLRGFVHFDNG